MNDKHTLEIMERMESKQRNRLEDLINQYGSTNGVKFYELEKKIIKEGEL